MTFAATILAAAADAAANEFGYWDGDATPWWEYAVPIAIVSLLFLPLPLAIIWVLHRFKLDWSVLLNASIVAIGPMVLLLLIRFHNMINNSGLDSAVRRLFPDDDPQFWWLLISLYVTAWIGSMLLGGRLKRKANPMIDVEAFE